MIAEPTKRPLVTVCAWCPGADLETEGLSHGICEECFERMMGRKPQEISEP